MVPGGSPVSAADAFPTGRWPLGRWVAACTAAEAIGMTAAAAAARVADHLGRTGGGAAPLLVVVGGGLVEGTALGVLQGRVLSRVVGRRPAQRWAAVTLLLAGVGWAAASAPAVLAGPGTSEQQPPPLTVVLLGAALLGLSMGGLLGAGQAWALGGSVTRPWRWVPVSTAAWGVAMTMIFIGATALPSTWPWQAVLPVGTLTGLAAGALLGVVSGWFLPVVDGLPAHNVALLRLLARPGRASRRFVGLRLFGRTSGHPVELPVAYAEDGCELIVVPGHWERKRWWRNLVPPAEVSVLRDGAWAPARARVVRPEEPAYTHARSAYRTRWTGTALPEDQPLVVLSLTRPRSPHTTTDE